MRKKYIRPEMDSEEFVTNEYISLCYKVDCNHWLCNYEEFIIKGKDKQTAIDMYLYSISEDGKGTNAFHCANENHESGWADMSNGPEEDGKYYHTPTYGKHHDLTIDRDKVNFS